MIFLSAIFLITLLADSMSQSVFCNTMNSSHSCLCFSNFTDPIVDVKSIIISAVNATEYGFDTKFAVTFVPTIDLYFSDQNMLQLNVDIFSLIGVAQVYFNFPVRDETCSFISSHSLTNISDYPRPMSCPMKQKPKPKLSPNPTPTPALFCPYFANETYTVLKCANTLGKLQFYFLCVTCKYAYVRSTTHTKKSFHSSPA